VQIPKQVEKFSTFALDSLRAELPESGTFDVVFGEEALDTLFDFFTYQCSAEANYTQKAKIKPGQSILGEHGRSCGDLITLYGNNTLARSPGSFPFDAYGFPNGKTLLIRDHHFQTLWGSVKYAGFLGIPATGEIGTVEVSPGMHPLKELLTASDKPIYHLLRFSHCTPNRVTGHFSAEIRSGYRIDPDGSRHPVRGGAVSGNIQTAFQNAHFSKETVQREYYSGPEGIRLSGQQICGK
jgi:predicted Zn-dependent protease